MMYPCPCCWFKTRSEKDIWTHDICPVCWWEDDIVQYKNPLLKVGANKYSLYENQLLIMKEIYKTVNKYKWFKRDDGWDFISKKQIEKDNSKNINTWLDYFNNIPISNFIMNIFSIAKIQQEDLDIFLVSKAEAINIVLNQGLEKEEYIRNVYDKLWYQYKDYSLNYDALSDVLRDKMFWAPTNREKDIYIYMLWDEWFNRYWIFTEIFISSSVNSNIFVIFV